MALIAKDKSVVVPGEVLAEGMDYLQEKEHTEMKKKYTQTN